MNGVRRFLGTAGSQEPQTPPQSATLPLSMSPPKPTTGTTGIGHTSSPSLSGALGFVNSPKSAAAAIFMNKDRSKPRATSEEAIEAPWNSPRNSNHRSTGSNGSNHYDGRGSPSSRMSSPRRVPVPDSNNLSRASTSASPSQWNAKRASGPLNTRDELLMSLMASEAVVDSHDYQVLSTDEVEDLKKEHAVLSSRLTKIRDAAISLSKVNSAHRHVSKQTEEQLEAANRRVDAAQKELWRVSERANDVQKRLLEHRAAVLSFSVRSMEKKMSPSIGSEDSGYDSSNRSTLMSPATAISSLSSSSFKQPKFDGAHLFAGHADTVVPKRKLSPETASKEIAALEEKLKAATSQLAESSKKQAEMKKELSHLQLEKQEVEVMMGMELQTAEETLAALEKELPRLEALDEEVKFLKEEKVAWEDERRELEQEAKEAELLKERVRDLETRATSASGGSEKVLNDIREAHRRDLEQKDAYIQELKDEWNDERVAWNQERTALEDEKMDDLTRLQQEMDRLREGDEQVLQQANAELNNTLHALRRIADRFKMVVPPRNSSTSAMQSLLSAVTSHLEDLYIKVDKLEKTNLTRQHELDAELQAARMNEESLLKELESTKQERDAAKRDTMASTRTMSMSSTSSRSGKVAFSALTIVIPSPESTEYGPEVEGAKFIEALQPLWATLPSPEARASKVGNTSRLRVGSNPGSPAVSSGANVNGAAAPTSLSDMDVRSLKSLYDPRNKTSGVTPNTAPFTLEGFIARVHALVADDRALIERLIRFAQAHDLLKKNAERAQKLALDGNAALETYQKQVKQLETRNVALMEKITVMQSEVAFLNENVERITAEKLQIESLAGDQAEQIAELSEANNTLSARTLALAEEAANAHPGLLRSQLEDIKRQLDEAKRQLEEAKKDLEEKTKSLARAEDEIDAMRSAEQGQRIALLDELNSMQTENGQLRAQLRAAKAGR
ncbi:Up-regulated during septation-domain-containing protein [Coprinopsis sp. MPI-PUGE-AT-0042]|nr:Up-regulated during septation-domain-containing protein [Coprinopsis sp. MPI-PUGE-AT-0042]